MDAHRRTFLKMTTALCLLQGIPGHAIAAPPTADAIREAWIYLIARALVVRQEILDRQGEDFAFNKFTYNPLGSANFVNPNFDVAYLEGWIAVDEHSYAVIDVPQIEGRYYTAQILDEWGEVIANINERTMPSKPFGKYALVLPGTDHDLPADMGRIELHSAKAKVLGRVELKGDPEGAVALQRQFTLSLSGEPVIAEPVPLPAFDNETLIGVQLFDHAEALLTSAFDVSPHAAAMQQQVRAVAQYVASGAEARAEADARLKTIVTEFQHDALTRSAPYRNHWVGGAAAGNYGTDYFLRAAVNYAGIWANTAEEVLYFVATRDSEEQPLDGTNSYIMHFPADRLPDGVVDAYWSVILVSVPDYRVVENPLKRYNFNSYSDLKKEADGSLKIAIGPEPVSGVPESNWLPSRSGQPFSLTFRTYVPKEIVRKGEWQPAPLERSL